VGPVGVEGHQLRPPLGTKTGLDRHLDLLAHRESRDIRPELVDQAFVGVNSTGK